MGVLSCFTADARHGHGQNCPDDRAKAETGHRLRSGVVAGLTLAFGAIAAAASAETLRIAGFNAELGRDGPGLLLRDLLRADPQAGFLAGIVAHVAPDVLVLQNIDYDSDLLALGALASLIAAAGHDMPYRFALLPNSGMATGQDMDGNGRTGEPRDAQGYGRFAGAGGMAVLSRFPVDGAGATDLSPLLWADLPGASVPVADGAPFPDAARFARQRLSSVAHWDVPLTLPDGSRFHVLTWHATPPVFDGPEDRNGHRNHDEAALWLRYLDGALPWPPPDRPFILIGDANLDPEDGDGRPAALSALLADSRVQEVNARSEGGPVAARSDGGANSGHTGDPALDTADWPDDGPGATGTLRVSYILPSPHWTVADAGVFWPAPGSPLAPLLGPGGNGASRHRLIWADLVLSSP